MMSLSKVTELGRRPSGSRPRAEGRHLHVVAPGDDGDGAVLDAGGDDLLKARWTSSGSALGGHVEVLGGDLRTMSRTQPPTRKVAWPSSRRRAEDFEDGRRDVGVVEVGEHGRWGWEEAAPTLPPSERHCQADRPAVARLVTVGGHVWIPNHRGARPRRL